MLQQTPAHLPQYHCICFCPRTFLDYHISSPKWHKLNTNMQQTTPQMETKRFIKVVILHSSRWAYYIFYVNTTKQCHELLFPHLILCVQYYQHLEQTLAHMVTALQHWDTQVSKIQTKYWPQTKPTACIIMLIQKEWHCISLYNPMQNSALIMFITGCHMTTLGRLLGSVCNCNLNKWHTIIVEIVKMLSYCTKYESHWLSSYKNKHSYTTTQLNIWIKMAPLELNKHSINYWH
jgi:hypothetical protein